MKYTVSLLIGSGFSIPEGLPGVKGLNERLSKINENEILIHSDQRALFLNGQEDLNRWSRWDERAFLQEFLEFYSNEILKGEEAFHYETFYDFYSGYLHSKENKEPIEAFYEQFNKRHYKDGGNGARDCHNRISDFNRTYNQLLASQLHKPEYFEDITTTSHLRYGGFIGFLRELMKTSSIKVHTLNHDLFFDWLGRNQVDLWQNFSDGYQLEGSPFYGTVSYNFNQNTDRPRVQKTYYVKLERFTDEYSKPLCLFKLHGSVYNTVVYTHSPQAEKYRLKDNYGVYDFYMEKTDPKTGEVLFERLWDQVAPDFLSGTTNKTRYYTGDPYYISLFKHFENNLISSDLLIVIGYGFLDPGINEYLEKYFLTKGKKMIVIDPNKPQSEIIDKYGGTHIPVSVTALSYDQYLSLLPEDLRPKVNEENSSEDDWLEDWS
jgi:hypothetical protein